MVLSKQEILNRMRKYAVTHRKNLVITPLLFRKGKEEDVFDADSVDLRLGCYFLLPKTLEQPFFSPDRNSATALHEKVHVPLGRFLVVPAHQTVLGATLEFIKLPHDVSGEVLTKSSVARTFIVVETAPWIHPMYRGCLTLEIANVSNTPVLLYPGRFICQLVLMNVTPEEGNQIQRRRGRRNDTKPDTSYFGPVYPEAPKFQNPEEDLLRIGVRETSSIRQSRLKWSEGKWQDAFCSNRQNRK